MKETVALELSFVNSNLQLLKEQLAELNSSVELYQMQNNSEVKIMRIRMVGCSCIKPNQCLIEN